jgi:hypothetical protein
MDPNLVMNHLLRLVRLDTTVFDEVRDDEKELIPSVVVAVVASFLAGLGAFLWVTIEVQGPSPDGAFLNTFVLGSIFLAVMYGIACLVTYVMLSSVYKVQVDLQALIRCLGYAAWPLALSVLMFPPVIYPIFAVVPIVLLFVTMIYAAQSASGADSRQVVMSCLAGFTVMVFVLGLIAISSGASDAILGAGIFGTMLDLRY